jgi:N-ethylmaleimide reductase
MKLFSRYTLGPVSLENRIVMAPMTRCRSTGDHVPTPLMTEFYSARASAGLLITEGTSPDPNGSGYARIPGIYNEAQVNAWRDLANAVHARGGRISVQLMHTGRVGQVNNLEPGAALVAPSAVALPGEMWTDQEGMKPHSTPRAMTENDIEKTIVSYVTAATNARRAGVDFVELHAANGYLINQFLAPNTNVRGDGWGGQFPSRARFALEVARRCAEAIGADRVGIRVSPFGVFNGISIDPNEADNYVWLASELGKLGLSYLHMVDHSRAGAPALQGDVKARSREAFGGPFILSGSYDAQRAESDLAAGRGDLVAFGKPFIANPDLVSRMKQGAPLAEADQTLFYTPGPKGYTDYPTLAG